LFPSFRAVAAAARSGAITPVTVDVEAIGVFLGCFGLRASRLPRFPLFAMGCVLDVLVARVHQ
jgi:hypothetical protein